MSILRSSVIVSALTMGSRVFGFIRDMVIANKLGAGASSDAVFAAMMIPNLLRRLFAEGAFNVAFVPILARLNEEDKSKAEHFSSTILGWLFIALSITTILGELFMPEIIRYVVAPGFAKNEELFNLSVLLSRITFPYLMMITFASFLGGICNTFGKFAPFALTPILLNFSLIGSLLILPEYGIDVSKAAAIAMPLGGIMQMGYMFWAFKKLKFKLTFSFKKDEHTKDMFSRLGPAALAVGILQISFIIDMHLASYLGESAVSYLQYANRFYQMPLALIGVALATVLLPGLSKMLKNKETKKANITFSSALTHGLALAIAATAGLFLLAEPLISLLFGHGKFTPEAVQNTAYAMMAFSLGLPAFVVTKVTLTAFYASEDTKTPLKISAFALCTNVILNLILMQHFAHVGLAMATALTGWVNASLQLYLLNKKNYLQIDGKREFWKNMGRVAIISVAVVLSVLSYKTFIPVPDNTIITALWITGACALGGVVFVVFAHITKLIQVGEISRALRLK